MRHLDIEGARGLLRGRLSPDRRQHWEGHVQVCAACRRLVDEERRWINLLQFDETPASFRGAMQRVLVRIEALAPQRARRRRRQRTLAAVGYTATALIVAAVVWSIEQAPRQAERLARDIGISTALQRAVVSNLDELGALRQDAWIADDFETVEMLDRLLQEGGPP